MGFVWGGPGALPAAAHDDAASTVAWASAGRALLCPAAASPCGAAALRGLFGDSGRCPSERHLGLSEPAGAAPGPAAAAPANAPEAAAVSTAGGSPASRGASAQLAAAASPAQRLGPRELLAAPRPHRPASRPHLPEAV